MGFAVTATNAWYIKRPPNGSKHAANVDRYIVQITICEMMYVFSQIHIHRDGARGFFRGGGLPLFKT
jgi:hypothetical protein